MIGNMPCQKGLIHPLFIASISPNTSFLIVLTISENSSAIQLRYSHIKVNIGKSMIGNMPCQKGLFHPLFIASISPNTSFLTVFTIAENSSAIQLIYSRIKVNIGKSMIGNMPCQKGLIHPLFIDSISSNTSILIVYTV